MKSQEKLQQLQLLEQGLQQLLMQKQAFQAQLAEVESAQQEIKTTDSVYKIVSNIMIKAKRDDVEKELNEKNELLNLRVKSIEKQEESTKDKVKKLRQEVLEEIKQKQK